MGVNGGELCFAAFPALCLMLFYIIPTHTSISFGPLNFLTLFLFCFAAAAFIMIKEKEVLLICCCALARSRFPLIPPPPPSLRSSFLAIAELKEPLTVFAAVLLAPYQHIQPFSLCSLYFVFLFVRVCVRVCERTYMCGVVYFVFNILFLMMEQKSDKPMLIKSRNAWGRKTASTRLFLRAHPPSHPP